MSEMGHPRTSSAFVAAVLFRAASGHRTSDSNDIAWLGWFAPVFVASGIGAAIYCLWTASTLAAARARRRG